MKTSRLFSIAIIAGLLSQSLNFAPLTPPQTVRAADVFNPNRLIDDVTFTARDAMSVAEIQAFLVSRNSVLARLSPADLGANANGRSAAQIIWDAGRATISDYGPTAINRSGQTVPGRPSNPFTVSLNPQVILATLQKEQSLVSGSYVVGSNATNSALRAAMGMGCPDSGGCDATYFGFANQVTIGAAALWLNYWRMANDRSVNISLPRWTGSTFNFQALLPSVCGTDSRFSNVTIENAATSSLYVYTTGCNGNFNFWRLMNLWFAVQPLTPTAMLLDQSTGAVFALINDVRYPLDSMETLRAFGFSESAIRPMTPTEATTYPVGPLLRQLLLDTNGGISRVINGKRHPIASRRTFELRFKWEDVSPPSPIASLLPYNLPYYELAKMPESDAIYIMTNGRGYAFPDAATYERDWGFAWDDFATTPAYTFSPYPLNGTVSRFVQGSGPAVFVMDGGRRLPIVSADAFNAWRFDWSRINRFDDRFLSEFAQGKALGRLVKGSGPAVFYVDAGRKRPIASAAAFTRNRFNWADVTQVSDRLLSTLPDGAIIR